MNCADKASDSLQTTLLSLKGRSKQQAPTKISTTVRFDREVLDALSATRHGRQTCMNDALKNG
ncbi:MAG: BrnA antitoxin family protein [Methylococcales bacterium]|nr:BrnA antitoxin family protein [Methylococcales bacterium]